MLGVAIVRLVNVPEGASTCFDFVCVRSRVTERSSLVFRMLVHFFSLHFSTELKRHSFKATLFSPPLGRESASSLL